MYSYNAYILDKSTRSIIDKMDDKFEDIDVKLASIENLINHKIELCYKRVNDVYSMQNKANEINKMNNQSINRQINQYDEENDDIDINQKNAVYNSIETSMSPHSRFEKFNNQCFIKHNNIKNKEREMFYMSSLNKNEFQSKNKTELSNTSSASTSSKKTELNKTKILNSNKVITCSSTSSSSKSHKNISNNMDTLSKIQNLENKSNDNVIFDNLYKKNKKPNIRIVKDNISLENDSNLEEFINSLPENVIENFFQKNNININNTADVKSNVILEMNSETVKPYKVEITSPKFANAMKILNETNFIKNNSYNKLNELNENNINNDSNNNKTTTNSSDNSSNTSELNINNIGENIKFINIMDFNRTNFIFADILQKQNNEKIVEL